MIVVISRLGLGFVIFVYILTSNGTDPSWSILPKLTAATTNWNEDTYELTLDSTTICENVSFEENTIASDKDLLYDIAM